MYNAASIKGNTVSRYLLLGLLDQVVSIHESRTYWFNKSCYKGKYITVSYTKINLHGKTTGGVGSYFMFLFPIDMLVWDLKYR